MRQHLDILEVIRSYRQNPLLCPLLQETQESCIFLNEDMCARRQSHENQEVSLHGRFLDLMAPWSQISRPLQLRKLCFVVCLSHSTHGNLYNHWLRQCFQLSPSCAYLRLFIYFCFGTTVLNSYSHTVGVVQAGCPWPWWQSLCLPPRGSRRQSSHPPGACAAMPITIQPPSCH